MTTSEILSAAWENMSLDDRQRLVAGIISGFCTRSFENLPNEMQGLLILAYNDATKDFSLAEYQRCSTILRDMIER